jgi:hypothetical protein
MRIKSERDFWSGLVFVATGIGFSWGATGYAFGNSAEPGPGYFPFGLGIILTTLGAAVIFEAVTIDTEDGEKIGAWAWRPLVLILASVAVFALGLTRLGMIATIPLVAFIAAMAGDEFHWGEALLNAAVLTLGSWLLFNVGLKLAIPVWPSFLGQ